MFFKKKKSEKGVLQIDIVTGLLLFVVSSGTIITMYYNIYLLMYRLKINQTMIGYVTEICEEIDAEDYADITAERVNTIKNACNIPSQYSITNISVKKYSDINTKANDVVKKVSFDVKYTIGKQTISYTMYKVKVKEK